MNFLSYKVSPRSRTINCQAVFFDLYFKEINWINNKKGHVFEKPSLSEWFLTYSSDGINAKIFVANIDQEYAFVV